MPFDRRALAIFLSALALLPAAAGAQTARQDPAPAAAPSPAAAPVVELSLDEAVARALENNVDIAVARFNPEASEEAVREVRGSYDPLLFSQISQNSRSQAASNVFAGADTVDTDNVVYNFGLQQYFASGGNLRVDFNNNRFSTNSVFTTFNPQYSASLNASFTQPLLRNFRIDSTRMQLRVARRNREISDVQFRQTVVNTVANVKTLYYDVLYAIDNLEAQRKSLALAQKLLEENRIRVRVGTMAPLDVVAAESERASREEAVILAEAALLDAEDALKRAIYATNDPGTWAARIVPSDRPTAEPVPVDVGTAVSNALEKRTDVVAARKGLENSETTLQWARNQELPNVDVVAAYGSSGIGGTRFVRANPLGPITETVPGGYSDALSDVFGRSFPTWTLGINITYPLFNRQADANAARARISRDQSEANLRRLEMQVTAEVRSAARAVETNFKRVESTRAARVLQERRLDAEEKKFAAGMSTNFLVTQAQRDLALAEVAELRAVADYRKSVVNFERVQEAGGGGVTFGGSSAAAGSTNGFSGTGGQATTGGQAGTGAQGRTQQGGQQQF